MIIGNIDIEKPIALAPMEDVTDRAFRLICKNLGADLLYTEFASAEALMRNSKKTIDKIKLQEEERPAAIQIFGSNTDSIKKSIDIVESMKPDFIDINCGCWVKKVAMRGEGAGLLRDLKKFEQVIKAAVEHSKIPVTVKTRLGWDKDSIVIFDAAKIVENSGAKALTVHLRTREQGYTGMADWSYLEKIKNLINIPLIGNGDVISPIDVKRMFETGVDGVMIGRGAISNPWIFNQAKYLLKNNRLMEEPSLKEKISTCLFHLKTCYDFKGEKGIYLFRKFYSYYFKNIPNISLLKQKLICLNDYNLITNAINDFFKDNFKT